MATKVFNLPSKSDVIDQFREAMRQHGIECKDEIIADGVLHRFHVAGDRKGKENGWYILHYDEHPAGQFGSFKLYGDKPIPWRMDRPDAPPMTQEEKTRLNQEIERQKKEREREEALRHKAAAKEAEAIWSNAVPVAEHEYLRDKGVKSWGLRVGGWSFWDKDKHCYIRSSRKALLIPMMDRHQNILSLQAIFPPSELPAGSITTKKYLAGGSKRGSFYKIGVPQLLHGKPVYILCEGYATGASIHEATGHAVLVCFDVGNLLCVATELQTGLLKKGLSPRIVIACDNDRWTTTPTPNPGVTHGKAAAAQLGGDVVVPEFVDLANQPTDFNDLHQLEGLGAVKNAFDMVLNQKTQLPGEPSEEKPIEKAEASPFNFLGYTRDQFMFYQHEQKLIKGVSQSGFQENTLLNLAPLSYWEMNFPKEKGGINKAAAIDWINRESNKRGYFDESRIRGRGAWIDDGRVVVHHGDRLTVEGKQVDLSFIRSSYIYPTGRAMPPMSDTPLTSCEGKYLLNISRKIRWRRPASAALLIGWAFLSPICGALQWRPHIWLTGGAGSGKTAVLNFLCTLVKGFCEVATGGSTEAGIRQKLGCDAIPVIMDEAESNDLREKQRMEGVLMLARQASSESQAHTLKGSANGNSMQFNIRSMFCLCSINTLLHKQADADRLTRLEILPNTLFEDRERHWNDLKQDFMAVEGMEQLPARLTSRAISMTKMIRGTINVFLKVGGKFFGSQRTADQFGTLMAGAWCISHDKLATEDDALNMFNSFVWDEHIDTEEINDAQRALSVITSSFIRTPFGELTVYQLASVVAGTDNSFGAIGKPKAENALRSHGINVDAKRGIIAFAPNDPNLQKLVQEQSFAHDLRGQLKRLSGITTNDNKPMRFDSGSHKVLVLPLTTIGINVEPEYA